jgi:hypothetical protein
LGEQPLCALRQFQKAHASFQVGLIGGLMRRLVNFPFSDALPPDSASV